MLPLAGVRILDFSHVVTGPFATGLLAHFGAEVIKVESATAVEPGRRLGPFRPGGPREPDGSALFASVNRNKGSVTINLKHARGVEIALALAERCDVLIENFSVGVMDRFGLGPKRVLERNPRLIYLSMPGLGSQGPRAHWISFNIVIQALSGLMLVTGHGDDPPVAVANSWADFVAGLHGALVVAAALERRDADGRGVWIDLGQYPANVLPLGHLLLASQRAGHSVGRIGNRSVARVPQGCYRCRGDDAWCVISIGTDVQWQTLIRIIDDQKLADPAFLTLDGRRAHQAEIDRKIEAWTRELLPREVERVLQAVGIPAASVRTNVDVMAELSHHVPSYQTMQHSVVGELPVFPQAIEIEGIEPPAPRPGPCLGEQTVGILQRLLGLSVAEIDCLRNESILS